MQVYVFKRTSDPTRLELISSTKDHLILNGLLKNSSWQAELIVPAVFRKWKNGYGTLFTLKMGSVIISSCFVGSPGQLIGYGKINHTHDAVIYKINNSGIEMFIFPQKARKQFDLFIAATLGKLDNELITCRKRLKIHSLTKSPVTQLALNF